MEATSDFVGVLASSGRGLGMGVASGWAWSRAGRGLGLDETLGQGRVTDFPLGMSRDWFLTIF